MGNLPPVHGNRTKATSIKPRLIFGAQLGAAVTAAAGTVDTLLTELSVRSESSQRNLTYDDRLKQCSNLVRQ